MFCFARETDFKSINLYIFILPPSGENAEVSAEVRDLCIKEFWLPDAEILNLKEFKTLDVLSKLEGLWLNRNFEIMYAVATRITFICPMHFTSFPLDVQGAIHKLRWQDFWFNTNLSLGKIEKENHIRKVTKSEERKVKNIGKIHFSPILIIGQAWSKFLDLTLTFG